MAILSLGACSEQQIYSTAQHNAALECQRYPDTRYEECMATVEKSYAEYEEELNTAEERQPRPSR